MAIIRIPALIDPHVHMVESNGKHWRHFAAIAKKAGYGALQVMPDLDPPLTDKMSLVHYQQIKKETAIPFYLTAAATAHNLEEIKQLRTISAVKVWLGTGPEDLVVTKEEDLRQILLSTDKVVMIHAEDEQTLLRNYHSGNHELSLAKHGEIFNRQAALRATVKAITAAKETKRRIYLCHISTGEEVELVREAKAEGIRIYAEVAPHHLFLTEADMERLGTLGKVNPPLRDETDRQALWQAIVDGTIDTIGSDSYSWWQSEKELTYEETPSGFPNSELTLPLLLTAFRRRRLPLQRFIALTSANPARIFSIPRSNRSLYVDIDTPRMFSTQLTDWHPYDVEELIGWPVKQIEPVSRR